MPDGVLLSDADGTILFANGQLELISGYSRDELLGRPVETLVPEDVVERHAGHRASYIGNPHTRPMGLASDIRLRRRDGTVLPVDISLSSIHTESGAVVLAAVRDATQRLQFEAWAVEKAERHAVFEDRERLAKNLAEGVIKSLFEIGMELQSSVSIGEVGEDAAKRIGHAVEQLDDVIHQMRDYVFDIKREQVALPE